MTSPAPETARNGRWPPCGAACAQYHDLGIDHFILSGQPHLEEAYHFAEGAAAELRSRGLVAPPQPHQSVDTTGNGAQP
ncbi:hypothetical protein [Dactylosporangium sp. CA-233914]|uniref:hypothetical protein n=1 Tax=Dactylosporangium sp. CA-233914 TaxID=3239934 RepID=UPI003D8DF126